MRSLCTPIPITVNKTTMCVRHDAFHKDLSALIACVRVPVGVLSSVVPPVIFWKCPNVPVPLQAIHR